MPHPQLGSLKPGDLALASKIVGDPHILVKFPIRLTAHNPYLSGRAALVFVSPHVVSPADDAASFGEAQIDDINGGFTTTPPPAEACIHAWFRAPEADVTYNIDFSIF